jgi:hypothetical protein
MGVDFDVCAQCLKAIYEEDITYYGIDGDTQMICNECVDGALDGLVNEWWLKRSPAAWGLVIRRLDGTAVVVPLKFNQLWYLDPVQLDFAYKYGVYYNEKGKVDASTYDAKEFQAACGGDGPVRMLSANHMTFSRLMGTFMDKCDPCPEYAQRATQMQQFRYVEETNWVTVPRGERLAPRLHETHPLAKAAAAMQVKVMQAHVELKELEDKLEEAEKNVVDVERKMEYAQIRRKWVEKPLAAAAAGASKRRPVAAAAAAGSSAATPNSGKRKRDAD